MELQKTEERFRHLFEHADDVIYTHDSDGRLTSLNPAGQRLLGQAAEDLRSTAIEQIVAEEDRDRFRMTVREAIAAGAATTCELSLLAADGGRIPADVRFHPVLEEGRVVEVQGIARDITEKKRAEAELLRLALHDQLTGLPNRRMFLERLSQTLTRRPRAGEHVAVLVIDVDNFKSINDAMGHAAGDAVLVAVAKRLAECVRPEDTPARIGGDEFAILVDSLRPGQCARLAERVLAAFADPLPLPDRDMPVRLSIGAAADLPGSIGTDDLLKRADLALYSAKRRGKSSYSVFDRSLLADIIDRIALEADLPAALDGDQLFLEYQPIVQLSDGSIDSAEALVRWRHPSRGRLEPAVFVPVAEECGLISELERWVLHEACRQAAGWGTGRAQAPGISVNISALHVDGSDLAGDVALALDVSGLQPDRLTIEITESALMRTDAVLTKLLTLKDMGVSIAIDDFGTGYSSLSYLPQLPVDVLKIDRAFTAGVTGDMRASAVARAIMRLAETFGLSTVAEGVETEQQWTRLGRLRCRRAQGNWIAPSLPLQSLKELMDRADVLAASSRTP